MKPHDLPHFQQELSPGACQELAQLRGELASIRAEIADLRALVAVLRPIASDAAADFCRACLDSWGSQPFFSVDLTEFASAPFRQPLREAMQRLCRTDCIPSPMQLSLYLRPLVKAPPGGFYVTAIDNRGTLVWTVSPAP